MSTKEVPAIGRSQVEAMRRVLNDSVAEGAERFYGDDGLLFEFYCECGDLGCMETLQLTLEQYRARRRERVLAHPGTARTSPGA